MDRQSEDAYQWLHAHLRGFLRFDGERAAIAVAPLPDGALVAPVMVAMLIATDTVLELPDDGDESMHLMVTLEEIPDGGGAAADRWRIWHGTPEDVNWARITIDAGRFRGMYLDGTVLMRANPLAAEEARACRTANESARDALRGLVRETLGVDAERPTLVGVDPWGLSIRRLHDVVRVPFEAPLGSAGEALRRLGVE